MVLFFFKVISNNDELKGKDKSTVNGYIRNIEQNNNVLIIYVLIIIIYLCIDNWISWKPYQCLITRGSSAFLSNIV